MKFKYYLRGIGIGIIFASIVLLSAYHGKISGKISDEEVIARAKKLGMVEANEPINKLITTEATTEVSTQVVSEEVTTVSEETTETTEESTKKSKKKKKKKEETTTEATTEATTETTTEVTTEAKKDNSNQTVEITVERGSSSYPICQKLQELGIIDDASKFDDYLIEHGYANRISVGTHKVKKGMDYKTIADLISDPIDKKSE
ncbi:MAG: endolytic transglycosylase MltG [Lachnospiraceae bacterium]|jgi:predicted RNA-binding protein|nr:endolytic transglycosylase MltG [Lachnospiraceae bacterium]